MGIVVFALEVLNALILFGNWENEPYKQKGTQSKKTKQVYYAKKKEKRKKRDFRNGATMLYYIRSTMLHFKAMMKAIYTSVLQMKPFCLW